MVALKSVNISQQKDTSFTIILLLKKKSINCQSDDRRQKVEDCVHSLVQNLEALK